MGLLYRSVTSEAVRWYDDDTLQGVEESLGGEEETGALEKSADLVEVEGTANANLRSSPDLSSSSSLRLTETEELSTLAGGAGVSDISRRTSASLSNSEYISFSVDLAPMTERCIHT